MIMRAALLLALVALSLLPGRQAAAADQPKAQPPRPEQVQSDVSQRVISIQSNFTGIEIVLFGSIDFSRAPSPDEGPYDVIMVIRGPNRPIVVRIMKMMKAIRPPVTCRPWNPVVR